MRSLFGLPAHPLLVHAPVVLIPLVTLLALVTFTVSKWRSSLLLPLSVSAVVAFVTTLLAGQSGEALDEALKGLAPIQEHEELADTARLLCAVFAVLAVASYVVARRVRRAHTTAGDGSPAPSAASSVTAARVLLGLTCLLGVVSTIWMIRTGHSGARAVWNDTFR